MAGFVVGDMTTKIKVDTSDFDKGMKDVSSSLDDADKKSGTVGANVAKVFAGIAVAISAAAVALGKAAYEAGTEFESSLAKASTLFGDTQVDVANLTDELLALSSETGVAAKDLGNTLYNALSAGIPASEDMSEATSFVADSAKLAKAGFTDIDTAMTATAKTLNAYGMGVDEAGRIHRVLMMTQNLGITTVGELGAVLAQVTPTAAAMGVSFEQVGASLATMTAAGIPTAQATTSLNGMLAELGKTGMKANQSLAEATKGTKYAGKSFQTLMKEGVPLSEVLDLMGSYAEKNGLALMDMFGSIEASKAALSIAGANSEKFIKNLEGMGTTADVVGDAYDKVMGTTASKMEVMKTQMTNMMIGLFGALQPLFMDLIKLVTDNMPMIQSLINAFAPIITGLLNAILPLLVTLIEKILPPLVGLVNLIMPILGEVIEAIMPVLITLLDALLPPLIELAQRLLPILIQFMEPFLPLLEPIMEILVPIIDLLFVLIEPLVDLLEVVLPPLAKIMTALATLVLPLFKGEVEKVGVSVREWVDFIKRIMAPFLNYLKSIFEAFGLLLKGDFAGAWAKVKEAVGYYIEGLKTLFVNLWDKAKSVFTGMKNSITTIFDGIKAVFQSLWDRVKTIFANILTAITTPINKARDTVKGAIDSIVGFFKNIKLPEIKFPQIKLPKFEIVGKFSLAPPEVPRLSITWNKEGAIFTRPTIFAQGVGEAGPEAVLPISRLAGILADTLEKVSLSVDVGRFLPPPARAMAERMPTLEERNEYRFELPIMLDGREIARRTVEYTDQELRMLGVRRGWAVGR